MIKTVVLSYEPRAKKMARQIEDTANEMEQKGYEFLAFSITESGKAILAFRGSDPTDLTPKTAEADDLENAE